MTGDASGRIQARLPAVLEHRAARDGRLRRNRLKIALAIAVVEGLLVVVGAFPWWGALVLATAALVVYLAAGRESRRGDVRDATWIGAVSQLAVVLVPVLAAVVTARAVAALVVLAAVALIVLLRERR